MTTLDLAIIKKLLKDGWTYKQIAMRFGVTAKAVSARINKDKKNDEMRSVGKKIYNQER